MFSESETSPAKSPPAKKKSYKLPEETKALLDADTANEKLWSEVTTALQDYPVSIYLGIAFLKRVRDQGHINDKITDKFSSNQTKQNYL